MTQTEFEHILETFDGRTRSLQNILRYMLYPITYYRSSVLQHSHRLGWIVQELFPEARSAFGQSFDLNKTIALALVHDDTEMVTGDIQLGLKSKMTVTQLQVIDENEERAIDILSERFPKMLGQYPYRDLLRSVLFLDCPEAKVMKYADKFDAFGEALHEIFAGNRLFTQHAHNTELGEIPIPPENYIPYLTGFSERYPDMAPLLSQQHDLLRPPTWIDFAAVSQKGTPHTQEDFLQPTGYLPYDIWKKSSKKMQPRKNRRSIGRNGNFRNIQTGSCGQGSGYDCWNVVNLSL